MQRKPENTTHRIATMAATLAFAATFAAPPAFAEGSAEDAAAATQDFFTKMSARDLAGVSRYLAAEGFTEIVPETDKVLQLNASAFEGLFKSGRKIALRAVDVQARVVGDSAIVTGMRVGYVAAADASITPQDGRLAFTMVWSRHAQAWQLQHIHLSASRTSQ